MTEIVSDAPVRWGVLGCARIFRRRMMPAFTRATNAEVIAIASRSQEKADECAAENGIARAYGDYETLLKDPDIEAVYLPLPNDLHCAWTLKALEAGKHVLCDKPAALTYADARRMADAARAAGRRLEEAFMFRHHPQHACMAEIARSGEIGEPVHFRSSFTYAADDAPNFRWNAAQGGGALLDVGVYPVNAARYHFAAEPVAVLAHGVTPPGRAVDSRVSILMDFGDGRTATLDCGFDQTYTTRCELIGREGVITLERAFQPGDGPATLSVRKGDDVRTERTVGANHYALEIEHFGKCVRDPACSAFPSEDGAMQMRVVEAIFRSMREGRRVEVGEILV